MLVSWLPKPCASLLSLYLGREPQRSVSKRKIRAASWCVRVLCLGPAVVGAPVSLAGQGWVGCPSRLALRSCPLPVSGVAPLTRSGEEKRHVSVDCQGPRAPEICCLVLLTRAGGGLASRGSKAVYVCNLTGLPLSSLIEKALFICFDTNAFSVLS